MRDVSPSNERSVRNFMYEIIDHSKGIQIILVNKKGNQKFYAAIRKNSTQYDEAINEFQASVDSKDGLYYSNPEIKVTP